jgi:hypothetical protein
MMERTGRGAALTPQPPRGAATSTLPQWRSPMPNSEKKNFLPFLVTCSRTLRPMTASSFSYSMTSLSMSAGRGLAGVTCGTSRPQSGTSEDPHPDGHRAPTEFEVCARLARACGAAEAQAHGGVHIAARRTGGRAPGLLGRRGCRRGGRAHCMPRGCRRAVPCRRGCRRAPRCARAPGRRTSRRSPARPRACGCRRGALRRPWPAASAPTAARRRARRRPHPSWSAG